MCTLPREIILANSIQPYGRVHNSVGVGFDQCIYIFKVISNLQLINNSHVVLF